MHAAESADLPPDMMVTDVCFGDRNLRIACATLFMNGTPVSFESSCAGPVLQYLEPS
jgi:hypothetical protein